MHRSHNPDSSTPYLLIRHELTNPNISLGLGSSSPTHPANSMHTMKQAMLQLTHLSQAIWFVFLLFSSRRRKQYFTESNKTHLPFAEEWGHFLCRGLPVVRRPGMERLTFLGLLQSITVLAYQQLALRLLPLRHSAPASELGLATTSVATKLRWLRLGMLVGQGGHDLLLSFSFSRSDGDEWKERCFLYRAQRVCGEVLSSHAQSCGTWNTSPASTCTEQS